MSGCTTRLRNRPGPLAIHLLGCILFFVSSTEIIRKLKAAGWVLARTKGSHCHFKHPTNPNLVTVPHPKKDLPLGTVRSIERASGVKLT